MLPGGSGRRIVLLFQPEGDDMDIPKSLTDAGNGFYHDARGNMYDSFGRKVTRTLPAGGNYDSEVTRTEKVRVAPVVPDKEFITIGEFQVPIPDGIDLKPKNTRIGHEFRDKIVLRLEELHTGGFFSDDEFETRKSLAQTYETKQELLLLVSDVPPEPIKKPSGWKSTMKNGNDGDLGWADWVNAFRKLGKVFNSAWVKSVISMAFSLAFGLLPLVLLVLPYGNKVPVPNAVIAGIMGVVGCIGVICSAIYWFVEVLDA
jgi:hypothetical protein